MMKKYMIIMSLLIIMSFLIAWTTSLSTENSTLPLTVIPGTDGSIQLVSAVPAEVTGSVISKGFEYRLKGAGAWTTVSAAGAFEADIAVPVGTHEFRVFAEVSGQGTLYSRTYQVMVVGGYDNNTGVISAQITQERADEIVCEYVQEWGSVLYAKNGVQTEMTITTTSGEIFELNYRCWVYYLSTSPGCFPHNCGCKDGMQVGTCPDCHCYGRYLIVNESNGNVEIIIDGVYNRPSDAYDVTKGWRNVLYCKDLTGDWVNAQQDTLSLFVGSVVYKPRISFPSLPLVYEYRIKGDSIRLRLSFSSNLCAWNNYYFKYSDDPDEQIEMRNFQNKEYDFYKRVK